MSIPINVNIIVYPCKICHVNVNNKKESAAQCDICQSWVHMKCNKLNQIDYKYLQDSNDPWYCLSCCRNIFPFGTQTNTAFISSIMTTNSFSQGTKTEESLLSLKLPSDLALLYNQFNNTSPEKNNDPENVVNSKFCDIDQIQTLKFPKKQKSLALFHINACSLNKNFDDLDHLLKCTNEVFDKIAASETRIKKQTSLTTNINLKNYATEFTLLILQLGACSPTLLVTYLINHVLILTFIKLTS